MPGSDSMVDRVARAIVESNHKINPIVAPWDRQPEEGKETARQGARAAIKAMREPSGAMVEAGQMAFFDVAADEMTPSRDEINAVWRAMLDAALRGE